MRVDLSPTGRAFKPVAMAPIGRVCAEQGAGVPGLDGVPGWIASPAVVEVEAPDLDAADAILRVVLGLARDERWRCKREKQQALHGIGRIPLLTIFEIVGGIRLANTDLLRTSEVARILGVNRATVTNWANRGVLPAFKYAPDGRMGIYRFRRADVQAFIERSRLRPVDSIDDPGAADG